MIELRPYQLDIAEHGVEILREYHILYLSMQVRTGKSLTAMYIAELYNARCVLFMTKKKAIGSIGNDMDKLNPPFDLVCMNYEQLHNIDQEFDLIICDEAHGLGQYPKAAEKVKLLHTICKDKPIIFLSGTPTPESFSQLYHQLWISSFSPFAAWPSFYKWAAEFVTLKKKYFFNRQINDYSCANKEKIDELTKHLFISFTQEEAGFIQPVKEEILTVRMANSTYLLIDYLRKHKVHIGRKGEEILADTAVKLMNKMHQIYSGSVIDEQGISHGFDMTKVMFIRRHFEGQKIGVFYKFKCEREMLMVGIGNDRITESPEEFAVTNKWFISQVQSGREGINLSSADALVMLNIDFSAVSYWQARARMQDKDRTKEALLYWVFSEGGIEHKIYERVLNKRDYTLSHFKQDYNIKREGALI